MTRRWSDAAGWNAKRLASGKHLGFGRERAKRGEAQLGHPHHLLAATQHFRGTVRYCYWRDSGYFLGIEFDPDSQWSRSEFEPEHLIDPGELQAGREEE